MNRRLFGRIIHLVLAVLLVALVLTVAGVSAVALWHEGRDVTQLVAQLNPALGSRVSLLAWLALAAPVLFVAAVHILAGEFESPESLRRQADALERRRAQARADRLRFRRVALPHRE